MSIQRCSDELCRAFHASRTEKTRSLNCVFIDTIECFAASKFTSVRSDVFRPWRRPRIVLPLVYCYDMIRCLKSAQKCTV